MSSSLFKRLSLSYRNGPACEWENNWPNRSLPRSMVLTLISMAFPGSFRPSLTTMKPFPDRWTTLKSTERPQRKKGAPNYLSLDYITTITVISRTGKKMSKKYIIGNHVHVMSTGHRVQEGMHQNIKCHLWKRQDDKNHCDGLLSDLFSDVCKEDLKFFILEKMEPWKVRRVSLISA